jgi:hypothetical protein
MGVRFSGFLVLVGLALLPPRLFADDRDEARHKFFETHIRPLLVEHCLDCHHAGEASGGLDLSSKTAWQRGGDSGRLIDLDDASNSLLLKAVSHEDRHLQMPPDGKLPEKQIDLLTQWVTSGAYDPREADGEHGGGSQDPSATYDHLLETHWAYRPLQREFAKGMDSIDAFVCRDLHANELGFAPQASPGALVRRLHFDLTGLPPTPDELAEWSAHLEQGGYEALVDELLASPRHAEHLARRWLDVSRYGESLTLRGWPLKEAWRYRDYVIDSFAMDRPFDEFVRQHIAGDLQREGSVEERRQACSASTFLALGNYNREEQDRLQLDMDVIDEQLGVIGEAFLGQTIACARCHDHKFDPIPTREYYALAGILASVITLEHGNAAIADSVRRMMPLDEDDQRRYQALVEQRQRAGTQLGQAEQALAKAQDDSDGPPVRLEDLGGIVMDDVAATEVGKWRRSTSTKRYLGNGYLTDDDAEKGKKSLTFTPSLEKAGEYEVFLAYSPDSSRARNVKVAMLTADGDKDFVVDQTRVPTVAAMFHSLGVHRFETGNQGYVLVGNEGTTGHVTVDAVVFVPAGERLLPNQPAGPDAAIAVLKERVATAKAELAKLTTEDEQWPRFLGVKERKTPGDSSICVRGNVHQRGASVPRGVPTAGSSALDRGQFQIREGSSGRLQLAAWLSDNDNTLTSRVIANRVWLWMMGEGIVRTPDNFGTTGQPPTNPELLDFLANELTENNWSIRHLVRMIVRSAAYRQSTRASKRAIEVDPENRLWSRAAVRKLTAEQLRDAILQISGRLELNGRAPTVSVGSDFDYVHTQPCRSIYVPIFRNSLPDIFVAFDYPDPSMVVGQRNRSVIPAQGLYLLNAPLVTEAAGKIAHTVVALPDDQQLERLYVLTLSRSPRGDEIAAAGSFLERAGERVDGLALLAHALIASPEFRYLK